MEWEARSLGAWEAGTLSWLRSRRSPGGAASERRILGCATVWEAGGLGGWEAESGRAGVVGSADSGKAHHRQVNSTELTPRSGRGGEGRPAPPRPTLGHDFSRLADWAPADERTHCARSAAPKQMNQSSVDERSASRVQAARRRPVAVSLARRTTESENLLAFQIITQVIATPRNLRYSPKPQMESTEKTDRIREKLKRELGPIIGAALADPLVVEVMLNPDGKLWVERLGRAHEAGRGDEGEQRRGPHGDHRLLAIDDDHAGEALRGGRALDGRLPLRRRDAANRCEPLVYHPKESEPSLHAGRLRGARI